LITLKREILIFLVHELPATDGDGKDANGKAVAICTLIVISHSEGQLVARDFGVIRQRASGLALAVSQIHTLKVIVRLKSVAFKAKLNRNLGSLVGRAEFSNRY
jgi:hypothetical protein